MKMLEDTCERGYDVHVRDFGCIWKERFEETISKAFS